MRRIRLQVRIEPLEAPSSPSAPSESRQEKILPWTEPCSEDLPISELWAKIESRFERIYPGRGRLRIKYLQDHYGSVLDTTETVGDIFDDRTGGTELNATSIVRVMRFPPDREELNNPQRFGSIMPESFARPQKRLFSNTQPTVGSSLGEMAIPENLEAWEVEDSYRRTLKRQRLQDATASTRFDPDRPIRSRERDGGETLQRRLSSVRQASILQLVEDSQQSLALKRPNPYGTPTSLSLVDRSNQISSGAANQDGIPDSPPGNTNLQTIVDLNDHDTKSESPDLGQSLYNVPLSQAGTPGTGMKMPLTGADDYAVLPAAGTQQLYTEVSNQAIAASFANPIVPITGSGVSLSQYANATQPIELRTPQSPTVGKVYPGSLSRPKQRPGSSLPRKTLPRNSLPSNPVPSNPVPCNPVPSVLQFGKELHDIYDPIETDTENWQKPSNPPSARRANLKTVDSAESPPFQSAKAPLTNGGLRPPSMNNEMRSSAICVHGDERHTHTLPEEVHRIPENTNIQASTTNLGILMEPRKVISLSNTEKHQESIPKLSLHSAKATEELGGTRIHLGRPEIINEEPPITIENKIHLPEKGIVEVPMRSMQPPNEEAQQERLDCKRKKEDAKAQSNMTAELERVAARQEAQTLVLQAKETGNVASQSRAVEIEKKERKPAEKSKVEEAQAKEQGGDSGAEKVKTQESIVETKPRGSKVEELKTEVLEKDAKQLMPEPTTNLNGIRAPVKQTDQRTIITRTSGRKDCGALQNRSAELSMQKARESSVHGRLKSLTPLSSSGSQERKTESLTALFPGSRRSRSSSLSIEHPNPLRETPSKSRKAGEQPPLTSALRKSPNALRRSVSISWANPIAPGDVSVPTITAATASTMNGDKRKCSSPITAATITASHARQPSVEIIRSSSASSAGTNQKKSRDPRKKTSTDTKKQTKLNVRRNVKQKGRVLDPPSPPKPVVEESLVISSDSDATVSTFYSVPDDDVQEIRKIKAGPSTKKKAKSDGKVVMTKAIITPKTPPDSQVDVAQQATLERTVQAIESATKPRQARVVTAAKTLPGPYRIASQQAPVKRATLTESATSSLQSDATKARSKASSQSPAHYVSSSPSSTSGGSAKSDADAVSSSPAHIAPEPSSQAPMEVKSLHMDSRRGSSNSVVPKDVKLTKDPDRSLSSHFLTTHSTQQTQNTGTASVENALDQQLQREARQFSEPVQIQVRSSPPMTRSQVSKPNDRTKSTPAATPLGYRYTMSGPRSANFRYPSLTTLKNDPPKYDPKEHLKHASFMSSQKRDGVKPIASFQTTGVNHDDESSSESDDESDSSSNDDSDKDKATRNPFSSPNGSQLSKKSDGRNAKGFSSLLKLAKRYGVNG